jgi:serine/threonine protein kinase
MTPVADCDLRVFLERTPLPKSDLMALRRFFGCLCSGVLYLHENKVRHKDIKPANILVKESTVLLTDFGTSQDFADNTMTTTVGRAAAFTAAYAAPEVLNYDSRNSSSDIWSLGCVFLDMVVKCSTCISHEIFTTLTHLYRQC